MYCDPAAAECGQHPEVQARRSLRQVARHCPGGLKFHDLRHSYATWLVDDGVPPTTVMRAMGHEKVTTTLELYARRTDDSDRILRA